MFQFGQWFLNSLGMVFIALLIVSFFRTHKKDKAKNVDEKTMLTSMVYPSLLSCVRNRALILTSFFAYYAFILNAEKYPKNENIRLAVSIFFVLVVFHNLLNYIFNHQQQLEIEGREESPRFWHTLLISPMEWLFAVVMLALIVGAHCLIKF
jgi:Sec-independent protein secretion pathway component TatC